MEYKSFLSLAELEDDLVEAESIKKVDKLDAYEETEIALQKLHLLK